MEPVENENAPAEEREESSAPAETAEADLSPEAEAPREGGESPDAGTAEEEEEAAREATGETLTEGEEIFSERMMVTESADAEDTAGAQLKAVIEAVIYVTDEPLTAQQIASALERPLDEVNRILAALAEDYQKPDRGLTIREVAGGFKMATKPEHHEPIRRFVKNLKPPLKLSLAALETLAVIAYKQPITGPEILEIRGVQGGGVLKTLIERKLIAPSGRKAVVGKPILYKTTREFLVQFGLKDLAELPTLKEFEELSRLALSDIEPDNATESQPAPAPEAAAETAQEVVPEVSETDAQPAPAAPEPAEEG